MSICSATPRPLAPGWSAAGAVGVAGELRVAEFLRFRSGIKNVPSRQARAEVSRVLEAVNASDMEQRRIDTLSQGYRQRIGLADALLGDPPVYFSTNPLVVWIASDLPVPCTWTNFEVITHSSSPVMFWEKWSSCVTGSEAISKGKIQLEEDREIVDPPIGQGGTLSTRARSFCGCEKGHRLAQSTAGGAVGEPGSSILLSIQSDAALGLRIGEKALEEGWVIMELRSEPATLESLS